VSYSILDDGLPFFFEYYLPDDMTKDCVLIMTPSKVKGASNVDGTTQTLIGIYKSSARYIFRHFPSMLLMSIEDVNAIIERTLPKQPAPGKIFNISTKKYVSIPLTISKDINYSTPEIDRKKKEVNINFDVLDRSLKNLIQPLEHGQQFDVFGNAITKKYDDAGNEITQIVNLVKDNSGNIKRLYNAPAYDVDGNILIDARDAYGEPVIGVSRGNTGLNIPAGSVDAIGNDVYIVYDIFNNQIIEITPEGGMIVYQQKLPIKLDASGLPIKRPIDIFNSLIRGNYVI
jgi:hypothetical protein